MKSITIEGQLRTAFGKGATRQIRSQGSVPAVIYGGAKEINFSAPMPIFKKLVYTPNFQLVNIKVDGNSYNCIMKDLQFDKVTDELIHVDFLELVEGKKLIASIPIKFTGTAKGVRAGGRFVPKIKSLKVKTLPKDLKEEIEILGPQLAKNVYASQRKIVDAVRALEESGEIVISGSGGDEYEVIS